jgi:ribonuclease-3
VFEVNALYSKNIGITYTFSLNTQSFVGGLYLDQGFVAVTTWLEKLLTPYSKAAYQIIRRQHGLSAIPITPCSTHPGGKTADRNGHQNGGAFDDAPTVPVGGHLSLFNQLVQKRNDTVEWKFSDREEDKAKEDESTVKERKVTPFWSAKVLVNGEDYGQGKGITKKVAQSEAAKQGLHKLGVVII